MRGGAPGGHHWCRRRFRSPQTRLGLCRAHASGAMSYQSRRLAGWNGHEHMEMKTMWRCACHNEGSLGWRGRKSSPQAYIVSGKTIMFGETIFGACYRVLLGSSTAAQVASLAYGENPNAKQSHVRILCTQLSRPVAAHSRGDLPSSANKLQDICWLSVAGPVVLSEWVLLFIAGCSS